MGPRRPAAALAQYVALVREFNGGGERLAQYPGSPGFATMLLRPTDPLHCWELHPTDERILRATLASRHHAKVTMADGFAALAHDLPPPSRRGVVLIDPPYELKTDYAKTVGAVREALQRFATGVILVWVPQVALVEARELPRRLMNAAAAAPKGALHVRLTVAEPHRERLRHDRQFDDRDQPAAWAGRDAARGAAVLAGRLGANADGQPQHRFAVTLTSTTAGSSLDLNSGAVVQRWPHIKSGLQPGCLLVNEELPPPHAFDANGQRCAIADEAGITVLQFVESQLGAAAKSLHCQQ